MDFWRQKVVYDPQLRRPACPEIQSKMGCASSVCFLFPKKSWLSMQTQGMRVMNVSEEGLDMMVSSVNRRLELADRRVS
jgi:hypothetical protein